MKLEGYHFTKVTANGSAAAAASAGAGVSAGTARLPDIHNEGEILVCDKPEVLEQLKNGNWIWIKANNTDHVVLAVSLLFWKKGNDGDAPDVRVMQGAFPGLPVVLGFPVQALDGEKLFLDRTPGKFKTFMGGGKLNPEQIGRFGIGIFRSHSPAGRPVSIQIDEISITGKEPEYPLPAGTFVDELGQWSRKDWTGKTKNSDEMAARLRAELDSITSTGFGDEYSRYGGYKGLQFEATGFFRTEFFENRWWLADPDGYAFFSKGLDCVLEGIGTRTDGIESLYAWLPKDGEGYGEFITKDTGRGDYVDFAGINLKRVFGDNWWESWAKLTKARMIRWGFNTIANWSSQKFIEWAELPYVTQLSRFPETQQKVFRDFPDVFSPEYQADAEKCAAELQNYRGDKYLIGYFLRNEPQWAFVANLNIAAMLLLNPAPLESKKELIRFLQKKYQYDINNLCYVWDVAGWYDFDELLKPWASADKLSEQARRDLEEFSALMIKRYVEVPLAAAKKADPDHLCLGLRWAWVSNPALYESGKDMAVFSINCYRETPVDRITEAGEAVGLPVMVGEFHHGALDAGLPGNGIRGVATQSERGDAYRQYVESAAANPFCVGTHYFTLSDQGILGRFDGENFQIGCVDICQNPYHLFTDKVTQVHDGLLPVIRGKRAPFHTEIREDTVGF